MFQKGMVYEPFNPVSYYDFDHAMTIEQYRYACKDDLIENSEKLKVTFS